MKYFVLLICLLITSLAQAQFPEFRASAIRQFGKSVEKASVSDAAFREKLSVLLPDPITKLERAPKDSSAFDAVVDATFLIQSDPARYSAWLAEIGVTKSLVPQISDYALLRFTNRMKPDPRRPAGFPFGLRLFRPQGGIGGYYLVRLEKDQKIELHAYDNHGYNKFTITGILKGNRVMPDIAHFANQYFFLEGALGVAISDSIGVAYHPCDLFGNFLQEPQPVFEGVTVSDILHAAGIPDTEIATIIEANKTRSFYAGTSGTPPKFPGGDESLQNYLAQHIKYPAEAAKARKTGTVHVAFVVTAEGKVTGVRVIRKQGYGMDEEAIRLVSNMPNWIPAKKDNNPAETNFVLPVTFSIRP